MATLALENLRQKLRFRRKNLGLSFSRIASETGCSASTVYRFAEKNGELNTDNRIRIGEWLGMTVGEIFGHAESAESNGDALSEIKKLISADETIPEDRREDLCGWFETTYQTFKKK